MSPVFKALLATTFFAFGVAHASPASPAAAAKPAAPTATPAATPTAAPATTAAPANKADARCDPKQDKDCKAPAKP